MIVFGCPQMTFEEAVEGLEEEHVPAYETFSRRPTHGTLHRICARLKDGES